MRILFLAFELPYPLDRGGRIKSYHFLRALARHHDVTLVALIRSPEQATFVPALERFCQVHTSLIPLSQQQKISCALTSLASRVPFIVSLYSSPEMRRLVHTLLKRQSFDAVYADHFHMSQYVPDNSSLIKILDQHNVESVILQRFFEEQPPGPVKLFAWLEWQKMRRYEPRICRLFDRLLAVTDTDRNTIQPWLRSDQTISVIPIGTDTAYFRPQKRPGRSRELVSIGTMSWKPNADGLLWFTSAVYPRIKEQVPDVKLTIVGSKPPPAILALADDASVTVTGRVDDVRPYMARSAAQVVPLQVGSGMRVKILNALAMGLPTVSTSVGCEGIAVTSGQQILIADRPADMAAAVTRLLREPDLGETLAAQGRRLIVDRYSWEKIYDLVGQLCAEIGRES